MAHAAEAPIATAVPSALWISSPNRWQHCGGLYRIQKGKEANGAPVWRSDLDECSRGTRSEEDPTRLLYRTPRGYWRVTDGEGDFAKGAGYIVSAEENGGRFPNEMQVWHTKGYVEDADITVTIAAVFGSPQQAEPALGDQLRLLHPVGGVSSGTVVTVLAKLEDGSVEVGVQTPPCRNAEGLGERLVVGAGGVVADAADALLLGRSAGEGLGLRFTGPTCVLRGVVPGSVAHRFGAARFIGRTLTHVGNYAAGSAEAGTPVANTREIVSAVADLGSAVLATFATVDVEVRTPTERSAPPAAPEDLEPAEVKDTLAALRETAQGAREALDAMQDVLPADTEARHAALSTRLRELCFKETSPVLKCRAERFETHEAAARTATTARAEAREHADRGRVAAETAVRAHAAWEVADAAAKDVEEAIRRAEEELAEMRRKHSVAAADALRLAREEAEARSEMKEANENARRCGDAANAADKLSKAAADTAAAIDTVRAEAEASLADIQHALMPRRVSWLRTYKEWSVDDVAAWIRREQRGRFAANAQKFAALGIDGARLSAINYEEITRLFPKGLARRGDRRALAAAIAALDAVADREQQELDLSTDEATDRLENSATKLTDESGEDLDIPCDDISVGAGSSTAAPDPGQPTP
eukprot:TRINITY_DN15433_c0_g2_i1.p1 TRINITY_DN15433_c0_g2~~TRINITY_DN15433_c0_g2_i1.p1  ORF type:complete len:665 (+),score=179.04 TRINITY_DN15433_c0_g2_i1:52-1995(+)